MPLPFVKPFQSLKHLCEGSTKANTFSPNAYKGWNKKEGVKVPGDASKGETRHGKEVATRNMAEGGEHVYLAQITFGK